MKVLNLTTNDEVREYSQFQRIIEFPEISENPSSNHDTQNQCSHISLHQETLVYLADPQNRSPFGLLFSKKVSQIFLMNIYDEYSLSTASIWNPIKPWDTGLGGVGEVCGIVSMKSQHCPNLKPYITMGHWVGGVEDVCGFVSLKSQHCPNLEPYITSELE